jgi:hypothetical protein
MKLGELRYNIKTEEGEVYIDPKVMPDNVVGLDIIRDWLYELTDLYAKQHEEVFTQNGKKHNGNSKSVL